MQIKRNDRRRERTIGFRAGPDIQLLLQAAAEIDGITQSEFLRLQTERAARRTIRLAGLRAGLVLGGKYEAPANAADWEKAQIPLYRAIAWSAAGIGVEEALDKELIEGIYPVDYLRSAAEPKEDEENGEDSE